MTDLTKLEVLIEEIGALPICPYWTGQAIRHVQRNMDFDVQDGFHEPGRYSGSAMAGIVNALPSLLVELARMREALEPFAKAGEWMGDHDPKGYPDDAQPDLTMNLTYGDYRRARAAYNHRDAK